MTGIIISYIAGFVAGFIICITFYSRRPIHITATDVKINYGDMNDDDEKARQENPEIVSDIISTYHCSESSITAKAIKSYKRNIR